MDRAARIVSEYLKRPVAVDLRSKYMGRICQTDVVLAAITVALCPRAGAQDRRVRVDVQHYVIEARNQPGSANDRGDRSRFASSRTTSPLRCRSI